MQKETVVFAGVLMEITYAGLIELTDSKKRDLWATYFSETIPTTELIRRHLDSRVPHGVVLSAEQAIPAIRPHHISQAEQAKIDSDHETFHVGQGIRVEQCSLCRESKPAVVKKPLAQKPKSLPSFHFRGVCKKGRGWYAQIAGKYLGMCSTEREAAEKVDEYLRSIDPNDRRINFKESSYRKSVG